MAEITYRALNTSDHQWVSQFIMTVWGIDSIVSRGRLFQPSAMPGFAAFEADQCIGLITYDIHDDLCEVITIDSLKPSIGIGTQLLNLVLRQAQEIGCKRLWLITTNDNLNALRFYQKWGLTLVAVYPNALENSRHLKPEIPLIGYDGIPLRDEIELELLL